MRTQYIKGVPHGAPFFRIGFISVILVCAAAVSTIVNAVENEQPDPSLSFTTPAQVDELLDLKIPGLAFRLVDDLQKKEEPYTTEWLAWETRRIELLSQLERWSVLTKRINSTLANWDDPIQVGVDWMLTRQAIAYQESRNTQKSLEVLRRLLWLEDRPPASEQVSEWRRLVIRNYLQADLAEDAHRAMRTYQQDYGESGREWLLLQARVLMKTDRPELAEQLLAGIDSDQASALRMIARLRSNPQDMSDVEQQLKDRFGNKEMPADSRRWYLRVQLEAARLSDKDKASIRTLEALAKNGGYKSELGDEFRVTADDLWRAYEKYGHELGNRYQLLIGDDVSWYTRAINISDDDPVQARAMFALLASKARRPTQRKIAHTRLVDMLVEQENGLQLVYRLYLHSQHINDLNKLPKEVRYQLVDYVLSRGFIEDAGKLMNTLPEPPEGEERFGWQLRHARILVLSGKYINGDELLSAMMADTDTVDDERIDSYMQVLFDLQTVGQHRLAIKHFLVLSRFELIPRLHREILLWRAESHQALGENADAAWLYLKSASWIDEDAGDPWGQTARYKAAQAMGEAGLYEDARRVYLELLRVTENPAQQSLIRQHMEQIRLRRMASGRS